MKQLIGRFSQLMTPVKTTKRDLQQLLMEEKTPLRDTDKVSSESHEKERMALMSKQTE